MKPQRLLISLFAGTVVMIAVMRWHGGPLITPVSDAGIVSLELAKTKERTAVITNYWNENGLLRTAITNTYIDFIFILFYSLFLYSYCFFISTKQQPRPAVISRTLGMGALVAGLCDVIENYFILQQLQQAPTETFAFLAWLFASIKFVLLGAAVMCCLLHVHVLFRKAK